MALEDQQDLTGLIGAIIISAISSAVSITQRILRGYPSSALWLFSESMAAMLSGFLMWDLYPRIHDVLPSWASMPLMVAFAAHTGGRVFQSLEKFLYKHTGIEIAQDKKPVVRKSTKTKPGI